MIDKCIILDASALTALLLQEPGHEIVACVAAKGLMRAVNVAEVVQLMYGEK
jgi:PIN domain nuclease of toxin-antitoxin system